jgi:hypothetical protein
MAWAAYLTSDGALVGYGSVQDGTPAGAVDRATMTDVPAGALTFVVYPIRPDLPTDGTYFYDQPSASFMHHSRRTARAPSAADAAMAELLTRVAAGEAVQVVVRDLVAKKLLPTSMLG